MKVSGFTFVRNAIKYDYPIVEAISSILPICDEVIVSVGNSEDNTMELVKSIHSPKIKIVTSVWDDSLREGGRVLAVETDKALKAVAPDSDWAFYIQGDEVIHERYLPVIKESMLRWKDDMRVEGLLFHYKHFYGSYDYIGDSLEWYQKEIRVIRNDQSIYSFRDAQGFRKNERPLNVKPVNAYVYHYGWVKPPSLQQAKQENFHKLWHGEEWVKKNVVVTDEFDYSKIDSVAPFTDTHPEVMKDRISKKNWKFSFDPSQRRVSLKLRIINFIKKYTGHRLGEYKNYKII